MNSLCHTLKKQRGVTLVEVVMATLICLSLSTTLYASFVIARNAAATAHHKAIATSWGASSIELLRADLPATWGAVAALPNNDLQIHLGGIRTPAVTGAVTFRNVQVVVTWTNP